MTSLQYPDNGQPLEDASILRNAVNFATAQRAFTAYNILRQPLEHLKNEALAFFAAEAFMLEMTSTEDLLGWLFVLQAWQPGQVQQSLWPLLDRVQVGSRTYSEERAAELLGSLDAAGLRLLLHIPSDDELAANSFPAEARQRINQAMPETLAGLKRLVRYRQEGDRLRVRGFNKLKHHFLALRTDPTGREVFVPVWQGFDETLPGVRMATLTIACTPENVRLMGSRSIIAQATLNSWLGIILWTRFDEPYENPTWAVQAFGLRGWREEP